jgi:two-component system phosphate regulon sensor histidine kinase PhoR
MPPWGQFRAFLRVAFWYGAVTMEDRKPIPTAGLVIAVMTFMVLLLTGVGFGLAVAILALWIGTLFLTTSRPPEIRTQSNGKTFARDAVRDLIENSAIPMLLTENERITIANNAALEIIGEHIMGQDTRMAFRQPEAIALLTSDKNGSATIRNLARRRDIWRMNRQQLGDDLAVIELINQTAEAEISRAHTDFVANASHELRTPLASIIGYVETLSEEDADINSRTSKKFLETILREGKRLQSLVSDLMSLSRIEAEKHERPSQIIELQPLVERASRDAAGPERVERLDLVVESAPKVRGDTQQLEQLMRNLVDNAFKYGAHDKPVTVRLDIGPQGNARIVVNDQGDGIAPEHIPHLTRRFYRTDPGRSRASGGTGLGLAIVKHIVERHHGRLDIESELGKGATITVRIPVSSTGSEEVS